MTVIIRSLNLIINLMAPIVHSQ